MNENRNEEQNQKKKEKNWFVRGLIIALIVFISSLIVVGCIFDNINANITAEIVVLIVLTVILALSEVFDKFNLGNLLSMSREKKKVEKELQNTVEENKELRTELFNIYNSTINNNNNNTSFNVLGIGNDSLKSLISNVEQADKNDIEEKLEEETTVSHHKAKNEKSNDWRRIIPKIEKMAIEKFCEAYKLPYVDLQSEVKLPYEVISKDPIMERNVVFDGYCSAQQEDIFIEVKMSFSYINYFTIYHMISKLFHYIRSTNKKAKLVLLIPEIAAEVQDIPNYSPLNNNTSDRLKNEFKPAISNGLLKIETIKISEDEINMSRYIQRND